MVFNEYRWFVSTCKPTELGSVELETLDQFANNPSSSVYKIYKAFKERAEKGIPSWTWASRFIAYKNVHKRVKRLSQLKLIEKIEGHYERGAKFYRISPYGLVNYVGKVMTESDEFIHDNKENIVIRSLLLEFFDEETIDSFYRLKEYPTRDIGEYLHECCSITLTKCKSVWDKIKQYDLQDILPNDIIIQKYMAYLDGRPIDQNALNEIKQYKSKLLLKLQHNDDSKHDKLVTDVYWYNERYFERYRHLYLPSNRNYREEKPPFPLLDIYYDIVWALEIDLEIKIKLLTFNLVSQLGEIINAEHIESKEQLEEEILELGRDYSLRHLLSDKKFIESVRNIKEDFDRGYKQFLYYH
jgi:hypothetical protein